MTADINQAITNVSLEYFATHSELHGETSYVDRAGKRYQRLLADLYSGTCRDFVCMSFIKDLFLGTPPANRILPISSDGSLSNGEEIGSTSRARY
jgi:hypothetical protein